MTEQSKPNRGSVSPLRVLFRGLSLARALVVNGLFVLFLLLAWALVNAAGAPPVPKSTVLVVAPRGIIVEQLAGDPFDRAVQQLTDSEVPEALLRNLARTIQVAKSDDRVKALYLDLRGLVGASLPILQELRSTIDDFQTSEKPVIASADFYNNARYYLAAGADEIYLHPMGNVMFEGFGRYRTYYKEGIDRFEIDWNVFRVGKYKSAVEPYLRGSMSDDAKEVNLDWLSELWNAFLAGVAEAREIPLDQLAENIRLFNDRLEQTGNAADMALAFGLVDHVSHDDTVRERLTELVGEDHTTHTFHQISHGDYLLNAGPDEDPKGEVAVIVAKGTILPGYQPSGAIGGQSTAKLIRQARQDNSVKAVVLRVDSGGGSSFASEVIRREFALTREAGKPVVVSMGSYAASGGYWISTAADELWASPNTVTGSIGIFGYFPTFQKPLAKYLGIRVDGVGTSWLSGVRSDRELPPEMKTAFNLMIRQGYQDFLERVAKAREMSLEDVHEIAQGRVWMGSQAKEIGLVDELGGLDDAVASAARLAGLDEGHGVRYLEQELTFEQELMISLLSRAQAVLGPISRAQRSKSGPSLASAMGRFFEHEIGGLAHFQDPRGVYAHCLCEAD